MNDKLSATERSRFAACKQQISEGLQTCFDTGAALTEIRDSKLYREEFDTFEDFCQEAYQIGKAYAYRLIESSEIKMSPIGDKIQNESQARAIAQVPEKDRSKVLKIAEKSGPVTAQAISVAAEQVEESKPAPKPEKVIQEAIELDKSGWPIPPKILAEWNRADTESKTALAMIVKMRSSLNASEKEKDLIYGEFRFQENIGLLTQLFNNFKMVSPHAVCTTCQGKLPEKCLECKGRGFVSGFAYQMFSKDDVKIMREKLKAKRK